jgi:hypothetical protein
LPAARLAFWFWVLSFDLACLRRANVSWLSVLSFDLVRLWRVVFFLARGALFGFGLPTALPSLDRGALFRFGSPLPVFSWLAALSFLSVVSLWLVACVCVFAPSLARALAYSARALPPLQRGCPCFEAKRARMSYGWTGHKTGSGFSDLAPSILYYNWF